MKTLKEELALLEADILAWRTTLNDKGVWLFISTLGCWSVPSGGLRLLALTITLGLFFWQAYSHQKKPFKPFTDRCAELECRIPAAELSETEKESQLYKLGIFREKYFSVWNMRDAWVFVVCFGFCFLSIALVIQGIVRSAIDRMVH